MWISSRETDTVVVIDPDSRLVTDIIQVGSHPSSPVSAGGAIWVPNNDDLTVSVIDPVTREVTHTLPISGGSIEQLMAIDDALWVITPDRLTRIEIR